MSAGPASGCLVLDAACVPLRRRLGPTAWMVLEDLCLVAVADGDGLVAASSARATALRLGRQPSTVGDALRTLRAEGIVVLQRAVGEGGRFGLASYRLHLPAGVTVTDQPSVAQPSLAQRTVAEPSTGQRRMANPSGVGPGIAGPGTDGPGMDEPCTATPTEVAPPTVDPTRANGDVRAVRRRRPGAASAEPAALFSLDGTAS